MKVLSILLVFLSSYSFAQDKIFEVIVMNPSQFAQQKSFGEFLFQFPKGTKSEVIEYTANYYKDHFTVSLDESSAQVKITMIKNTSESRHIINRFFVANKITQINMDGKFHKLATFYQKFLK